MKKETYTISFRLDSYHLAKLEGEASKHQISVHEQARRTVIDSLNRKEAETILERLSELQAEVKKVSGIEKSMTDLRSDLAEAIDWIVKKLQKG